MELKEVKALQQRESKHQLQKKWNNNNGGRFMWGRGAKATSVGLSSHVNSNLVASPFFWHIQGQGGFCFGFFFFFFFSILIGTSFGFTLLSSYLNFPSHWRVNDSKILSLSISVSLRNSFFFFFFKKIGSPLMWERLLLLCVFEWPKVITHHHNWDFAILVELYPDHNLDFKKWKISYEIIALFFL